MAVQQKMQRFPIIEDFTGDGINDMVGRVYTHYFGDIDWILTEEEKEYYKEMFEIADLEKKGTIDETRLLSIMEDMTD